MPTSRFQHLQFGPEGAWSSIYYSKTACLSGAVVQVAHRQAKGCIQSTSVFASDQGIGNGVWGISRIFKLSQFFFPVCLLPVWGLTLHPVIILLSTVITLFNCFVVLAWLLIFLAPIRIFLALLLIVFSVSFQPCSLSSQPFSEYSCLCSAHWYFLFLFYNYF